MLKCPPGQYFIEIAIWNSVLDTITYIKVSSGHFELEDTIKCYTIKRHKGSNTGKRARRKISDTCRKDFYWSPTQQNLVRDQKSFPWVSEIFPSCPLTGVWFFFSLIFYWKYSIFLHETPHTWNMTWHIFCRHRRMTSKVLKRISRNTKKWK